MTEAMQTLFKGKKAKGQQMGRLNPQNYESKLAAGETVPPEETKAYEAWKAKQKKETQQ